MDFIAGKEGLPAFTMELLLKIAIATGSGLVIGLEREFSNVQDKKMMAGFRTFPLISLFGFLSAFFANLYSPWMLMAGLPGVLVLIVISRLMSTEGKCRHHN